MVYCLDVFDYKKIPAVFNSDYLNDDDITERWKKNVHFLKGPFFPLFYDNSREYHERN